MEGLRGLLHSAKLIGGRNASRAVGFALRRDLAERRLEPFATVPAHRPGRAEEASLDDRGARVRFAEAVLDLRFPRPGQVSVGWDDSLDEPSYAVVPGAPTTEPRLEETPEGWRVSGPGVSVLVGRDGATTYLDDQGRVRRADSPPTWHGDGWTLRTTLADGATVHGLGGRSHGWDLRGHRLLCWNTDPGGAWLPGDDPLYVTTPAYAVLDGDGAVHCFLDNPCRGTVDLTGSEIVASFEAGPTRLHVSVGTLPEVVDAYTALTGRPAAPPRWALGLHQARWGYGSSEAVREVAAGYRSRGLPLSAIHVDIDHMEQYRNFTFGEQAWPDPAGLVADLAEDGTRLVVIVDAGVAEAPGWRTYDEGLAQGHFCRRPDGRPLVGVVWPGPTVWPDFTEARTRDWWGEQFAFYAGLGVAGYWHDMNEPSCFAAWGEPTMPLTTRHDLDGRPADHRWAHNVFGLQMTRASYEGLRRLQPDRRPFLFSRSGWAGSQRYGGQWSGDIEASWPSLRGSLTQCLGYGVSGIGYYGPDIGGFTGDPSPELFTRWFQLSSFLPFFRIHCAWHVPRREPWEWGEEVMGHLRIALDRRYRMLPLWYSLALESARSGAPYVRPLAWADAASRSSADEFLLGDDVLVAPVLEEGATVRRVALPAGTWWHGDTGAPYAGTVELPVGPGDTPWFVRAGAVVPTEEDGRLVLLVAPPDPGRPAPGGRLLTDAGDGWEAAHEEHYAVAEDDRGLVLTRTVDAEGAFTFSEVSVRSLDGRQVHLA